MLTGNTLKSGNFSVIWDYSRKGFYKTTSDCKQVNIVVFVSKDRLILTVARFAGAATVCKARIFSLKLKPLKISNVSSRNKVAGIFAGIRYGRGLFQGKRGLTIEIFLYLRPNREVQRSNNSYSEYQSLRTPGFNELKEESLTGKRRYARPIPPTPCLLRIEASKYRQAITDWIFSSHVRYYEIKFVLNGRSLRNNEYNIIQLQSAMRPCAYL